MTEGSSVPSHRVALEREVRATAEKVWAVLTDVEHADQTLRGVARVELMTDGPYGVGTEWRETRRMFGKETTEQLRVTVAEPPTRTVIEAESGGVHYVTEFTVTASGDITRLAMAFAAVQPRAGAVHRVLWRLLGPLGAKATAKAMAKDLEDIAARAERS